MEFATQHAIEKAAILIRGGNLPILKTSETVEVVYPVSNKMMYASRYAIKPLLTMITAT
jgi:hypothetical protein